MSEFWLLLVPTLVGLSLLGFVILKDRVSETARSFLVANRRVGALLGAVTLAACWTQAPALLGSGAYAYRGEAYFVVFWVPNVLAMVVPVFFVFRMRCALPDGFTVPQYMGEAFGPTTRTLSFVFQLASLIGVVAFTMTGIAQWLEPVFDVSSVKIAITIGGFAFAWVFAFGLKSALASDTVKVAIFLAGVVAIGLLWVAWWPTPGGPLSARPPQEPFLNIVWGTGVLLAISLIGGPLCNPDIGERNFALVSDETSQRKAYLGAAAIFGIATLAFGSLGFLAHDAIKGTVSGFPAFAIVKQLGPSAVMAVSFGLAIILAAAIAAYIASAGDLMAIEVYRRWFRADASDHEIVWASRICMLIPILAGTLIAITPGASVPKLLESLAVVRAEMIIPIFAAAYAWKRVSGTSIAVGMMVGIMGGLALTYGPSIDRQPFPLAAGDAKTLGALWGLCAPGVAVIFSRIRKKTAIA